MEHCRKYNEKCLVFSSFVQVFNTIEGFMNKEIWKQNENYLRLDGTTSSKKRKEMIENFNTKRNHVIFLITSKAGGQGINLTAANRVVLLDVGWNPTFDCKFHAKIVTYHFHLTNIF